MTDPKRVPEACELEGIMKYVSDDRRKEFLAHISELFDSDHYFGGIDHTFVGFIDDYINYNALLKRKADCHDDQVFFHRHAASERRSKPFPITVFDVGCATALQHLVFDPRIHYVGIDESPGMPEPKFFRENCKFIRGKFSEVVGQLGIPEFGRNDWAYGIANMSILYWPDEAREMDVFNKIFRRKFVI